MTDLPAGFVPQEFVPPDVFSLLGDQCVKLIDPRILLIAGQLRTDYGPIVVNNWHAGGQFRYRGFRPLNCREGAPKSQHRLGTALDCHSPRIAVEQLRREVIAKARTNHPVYSLIGAIEDGVNWLHFDVRPRIDGRLMVFTP